MLKEKLLIRLNEYKKENKKLTVKWDTGGDETIINFFLENNALPHTNELMNELAAYLIEAFDLPNAGEYYNEGGGALSIENENSILFIYDEFAYRESYGEHLESENLEEEFSIAPHPSSQRLLADLNQKELNFNGSASFLLEASFHFDIYSSNDASSIKKEAFDEIKNYIKIHALAKIQPPFEGKEIVFSGRIKEDEILFEEFYQIKYNIDKNKKEEKIYLLDHKENLKTLK